MYSIGWFSSAKGPGSRNLLTAVHESIQSGEIQAKIEFIFLSREPGEAIETDKFLELANSYDIPVISYSYRRYKEKTGSQPLDNGFMPEWRKQYDREVIRMLSNYPKPDLCVLAGYMLIVSEVMCSYFKMINLHPAAPDGPTGTWRDVIWKLIEERSDNSGVMTHLVTPELDRGPVVSYCRFSCNDHTSSDLWKNIENRDISNIINLEGEQNSLFKHIRNQGVIRELPLIIHTLKAFGENRLKISNNQILDQKGNVIKGYDLSEEIDRLVKG